MSAYSEWKAGIISDSEYSSICREEDLRDMAEETYKYEPMSDEDKINMYPEFLAWIWDQCGDVTAYIMALNSIGFSKDDIYTDLKDAGWDEQEIYDVMEDFFG